MIIWIVPYWPVIWINLFFYIPPMVYWFLFAILVYFIHVLNIIASFIKFPITNCAPFILIISSIHFCHQRVSPLFLKSIDNRFSPSTLMYSSYVFSIIASVVIFLVANRTRCVSVISTINFHHHRTVAWSPFLFSNFTLG